MADVYLRAVDYFIVRKRQYHLGDLYTGNATSAYWYTAGFNWRGFAAWAMGIWPVLPGFVRAIQGVSSNTGWDDIYQVHPDPTLFDLY